MTTPKHEPTMCAELSLEQLATIQGGLNLSDLIRWIKDPPLFPAKPKSWPLADDLFPRLPFIPRIPKL